MVRIATASDAQETAWVTNSGTGVEFVSLSVRPVLTSRTRSSP